MRTALFRYVLKIRRLPLKAAACLAIGCAGFIAADVRAADSAPTSPGSYTDGQKVDVREGDEWSQATILKREGRKYHVHYEGANAAADEWVGTDRIRPNGNAGGQPAAATNAAPAKPLSKPATSWKLHTTIDVKWGGAYRKANIVNKRGDWYLVNYDNGPFEEWVEPWRIRAVGSTDDPIGYAQPNPAVGKGKPSNPPSEKPGPRPEAMGHETGDTKALESESTPLTAVDRSSVREIVLGGGEVDSLKLAPDAEARPAKPPVAAPLVLKGSTGEFFDHIKRLFIPASEGNIAAVVFSNEPPGKPADVRVERIDLAAGESLGKSTLPVSGEPLDFSADGKLFLSRSNGFGFGAGGRLDVWQVDVAEARQVVSFVPFENQQPVNRDVKWARLIDADHVIILSGNGQVSLWNFRKAKEIWSTQAEAQESPALSANGKYLAVTIKGNEIAILEAMTGKTMGRLSVDSSWGLKLSFKPDGTQLAAASEDELTIWDLATGKRAYELILVGVTSQQIAWPSEGFVLLDGKSLVALDKKMVVWTYQSDAGAAPPLGATFGGRYAYVAPGGNASKPVLVSVNLPNEPARRAAASVNPDAEMIVKPASTISFDVSLPVDIQDKAVAGLHARLKQNGVTVADNAPVKLVARSEPGETREIEYRSIGMGARGGTSRISVTGTKNDIRLETTDGKILWERKGATSPPMMVMMKQGQTIEQAIAEAMKPPLQFFEKAKIPKYISKSKTGLGSSTLSASGIQNADIPL